MGSPRSYKWANTNNLVRVPDSLAAVTDTWNRRKSPRSYLTHTSEALIVCKWARMLSQAVYNSVPQEPKNWANLSRDILTTLSYVQLRQNMQFSQGNLGIYAEESDSPIQQSRWAESIHWSMSTVQHPALLPQMDRYGPTVRQVEVFHRGDYRVPIK